MNVLMLNQSWFKLEGSSFSGFKYPHASMTRNILLAHHIASLDGVNVYFQTADQVKPDHPFNFKWWDGKNKTFDVVVSIQNIPLKQNPEWQTHPFIVMYGDMEPTLAVRVFIVDSPILFDRYKTKYPDMNIVQGVWGVTDWDRAQNPYKSNKPIVFFSGHVYLKETISTLNLLAEEKDFELWAVIQPSINITGADYVRGFTDEERHQMLSPNIHLVSDVIGSKFGHGPAEHGTFTGFLQYADVGLCLGQGTGSGKTSTFCKVYEYLGNGLPIVIDSRVPDVGNVMKIDGGTTYDYKNYDTLLNAIKNEIACKRDKQRLRADSLRLWGWEAQAKRFVEIVERS